MLYTCGFGALVHMSLAHISCTHVSGTEVLSIATKQPVEPNLARLLLV